MRRSPSLDAVVVGAVALGNWALLFADHTVVQVTRDAPLWQLFPGAWGGAWLLACGIAAAAYPIRDLARGRRFGARDRALHLAAIVALFVVVPTVAAILLRATGKPYTYVHDGAIIVEEAARKLLAGQDPYAVDYLDTPLFYWPMINNPALYHVTYFPILFLAAVPFVRLFDALHLFFDVRYLYLPAYVATLLMLPFLIRRVDRGDAISNAIAETRERGSGGRGEPALWRGSVGPRTERTTNMEGGPGERPSPESRDPRTHVLTRPSADLTAYRLSLVAIVALDPELFPFVAEGRNDFFVLCFLVAGIALLQRERRTLGVLLVSVAAAAKLHAGLLLPFVVAYLVWRDRGRPPREIALRLARAGWAGALLLVAVFAPFIVWEPFRFWDDIVSYNAGGAAWSYPISGLGFSALLLDIGVISYPQQDFPFWAFQLAAAAPLAAWALRRLRAEPTIATLLAVGPVTLLAFLFFARYFQGNHLGFLLAVAAPVPFLRPDLAERAVAALRRATRVAAPVVAPAPAGGLALTAALTADDALLGVDAVVERA